MVAKIRRERIWFPIGKDQRANGVEQPACDEQRHGACAKLVVDGTDQEDDDPAHEQKTQVRHPYRDFCKENGFQRDEENCQTPNDAEQDPTGRTAEDGKTKRCVGPGNEDVDGVMVENAKDAQVFIKE